MFRSSSTRAIVGMLIPVLLHWRVAGFPIIQRRGPGFLLTYSGFNVTTAALLRAPDSRIFTNRYLNWALLANLQRRSDRNERTPSGVGRAQSARDRRRQAAGPGLPHRRAC